VRPRRSTPPSPALPDGRSEPVRLSVDPVLLGAVLALVSLGLVMVYSASAVTAAEKQGNGFYFLERQLIAAGVGLVAMAAAVRLLRQQEEAEEARVLEGIRQGLDDMRAGRTQPLAEAFADIRRDLNLPQGS